MFHGSQESYCMVTAAGVLASDGFIKQGGEVKGWRWAVIFVELSKLDSLQVIGYK